jgi:hypothetical protein
MSEEQWSRLDFSKCHDLTAEVCLCNQVYHFTRMQGSKEGKRRQYREGVTLSQQTHKQFKKSAIPR